MRADYFCIYKLSFFTQTPPTSSESCSNTPFPRPFLTPTAASCPVTQFLCRLLWKQGQDSAWLPEWVRPFPSSASICIAQLLPEFVSYLVHKFPSFIGFPFSTDSLSRCNRAAYSAWSSFDGLKPGFFWLVEFGWFVHLLIIGIFFLVCLFS